MFEKTIRFISLITIKIEKLELTKTKLLCWDKTADKDEESKKLVDKKKMELLDDIACIRNTDYQCYNDGNKFSLF